MIARSYAPALLCLLAFAPFARFAGAEEQLYTVEAIRYGTLADFPVRGLVQGADPSRKMDIAMVVWLVRGGGHNILVDAGFYRPQFFQHWNVKDFKKPSEADRRRRSPARGHHRCNHHALALGPRRRRRPFS